jgi:hypothetical protein
MKGSARRCPYDTAESETLGMWGNSMCENREALQTPTLDGGVGRSKKAKSRKVDMHVCGESDGLVVPTKRANKAGAKALAAESAEGRRATKGNAPQAHSRRTQSWDASHKGCGAYDKPYPNERLAVTSTRGKSHMRESLTYGSVRGPLARAVPTATSLQDRIFFSEDDKLTEAI